MKTLSDIINDLNSLVKTEQVTKPVTVVANFTLKFIVTSDGKVAVSEVTPNLRSIYKQGRPVSYHGKYFKSISKAARETGINRHWVRRWAEEQHNGWKWENER